MPRLVDLIRVENEEMRTVFYHYLKDTLVAEDMSQAKRVAFGSYLPHLVDSDECPPVYRGISIHFSGRQRFRVVTLNGDMCEVSGAMSGGGAVSTCTFSKRPNITPSMLFLFNSEKVWKDGVPGSSSGRH